MQQSHTERTGWGVKSSLSATVSNTSRLNREEPMQTPCPASRCECVTTGEEKHPWSSQRWRAWTAATRESPSPGWNHLTRYREFFTKSTAFTWCVQIGKRPQKTGGSHDRWKRGLEGDWMNPSVHDWLTIAESTLWLLLFPSNIFFNFSLTIRISCPHFPKKKNQQPKT